MGLRVWFVEHPSETEAAQQSVTKFIASKTKNLVTPKAAAKCELLFCKPASGEGEGLSNSSRLAATLGVTKFITNITMNLVTLCFDT
jgi:hypothetical protein